MNYAEMRKYDVTNAPNIRATLFVSGCTHNCEGCFNKEQQDFNYGKRWTQETEDIFIEYVKNPLVKGVNILGGEPLQQDKQLLKLLKRIKEETNKNIWLWTGYTYENIKYREELKYIDTLVDGKFEIDKRDIKLKYRGSKNQRIINLKG